MTDESLIHRFKEVERRLLAVETDVKTRADGPAVVRELQYLRNEVQQIEDDTLREVREARAIARKVKEDGDKAVNYLIRSGRSENLKLILYTLGGFATILGGILFGGKI